MTGSENAGISGRGTQRKEITEMLLSLIEGKTSTPGIYSAREVALDWGSENVRYVDYMTFSPKNTISVAGIEKGIFTCYEIKSCYEDLYSGHGLNFIGEKNYIVTTMNVYQRIVEDQRKEIENGITSTSKGKLAAHIKKTNPESRCVIGYDVGIMVAIPADRSKTDEFDNPTPLDKADTRWKLAVMLHCRETDRKRSMTELLFCMMRARG